MRVVLDTNVLISDLLVQRGYPDAIYHAWGEGDFVLITCPDQIEELKSTLSKPSVSARVRRDQAGRLINQMKQDAEMVNRLPRVRRSPDPTDDFLLAIN